MTPPEPQRPDLARELIARAAQSTTRRTRRRRNQLDDVQLGQGRHADYADTSVLRRILAEHDWPGHRLVGPDGAGAAWRIALHSDDAPDFQRAAAILLERAAHDDDALIQHWAHLHDRALVTNGRPQEFGTQLRLEPQGIELCALRAPDSVDQRRASVGLQPIATSLKAARDRFATDENVDSATVLLARVA